MSKISYLSLIVTIILLQLSLSPGAFAQNPSTFYEENPRTFYGGLLLGANFSQVDGDNYAGYHKAGLNAGGIMYIRLEEQLAASIELNYAQKGSRSNKIQASNSRQYAVEKYYIDLNYAEIPLQLNYFDRRKSHFGGGLSYSRLISSKETIVTTPAFSKPDTLNTFPFKKSDLGLVLGGSLHVWKGFFLNLRFQYSLLPIRKKIFPEFGRAEQYNNTWTFRIMYLF